uniref:Uncharacterized protein n=1 Tax=Amphimedon queenslandica TaxID=400682 RepID=A0A1X7T2G2_AMPQE
MEFASNINTDASIDIYALGAYLRGGLQGPGPPHQLL